jgi:hypothetical protein
MKMKKQFGIANVGGCTMRRNKISINVYELRFQGEAIARTSSGHGAPRWMEAVAVVMKGIESKMTLDEATHLAQAFRAKAANRRYISAIIKNGTRLNAAREVNNESANL